MTEIGPYRTTTIHPAGVYVSTVYRESSAWGHHSPYFETMAFPVPDTKPAILWQSAAGYEREAIRQHGLAVRWFARRADSSGATT